MTTHSRVVIIKFTLVYLSLFYSLTHSYLINSRHPLQPTNTKILHALSPKYLLFFMVPFYLKPTTPQKKEKKKKQ